MATTNALAGTAFITVNGTTWMVTGEATYAPSGSSRETLKGQSGIHGYKEMPAAGFISWTGRDANNQLISDLQNAVDVTVVLEAANGKTIIGRNMWRAGDGPIEVNTEEASFTARFEGGDVTEN